MIFLMRPMSLLACDKMQQRCIYLEKENDNDAYVNIIFFFFLL